MSTSAAGTSSRALQARTSEIRARAMSLLSRIETIETDGLPPVIPVDPAMLVRVGADFGLEILGPPLSPRA